MYNTLHGNRQWRKVFLAPGQTPVAALQGEVGCLTVVARIMKVKFLKYLMNSDSGLVWRGWRNDLACG